ncbi:MAG: hypothetical protein KI785_02605 [Devosiaceae bacterium]|nr:hypothetical protein [Devosiaceae bacterium MH13]
MNVHSQGYKGTQVDVETRAVLLATVKGNQTVAFLDEATGEVLAAPVVGTPQAKPHEIILSPDGARAFVSLYGDKGYPDSVLANRIAILDVASMSLEKVIDTDLYVGPHGLARDHRGRIWVTVEGNQCVLVINPESCSIERSVYTETRCHFIFPSRDGRLMYTAHKELPYIGVLDAQSCAMIDKIDLDIGSQAIWHAPDKDLLYVGDFFRPQFHVVDTKDRRVIRSVPLRGIPGWPYATPDGQHIVVSTFLPDEERGFAEVFDAKTYRPLSTVELPAEPFHVLDGADGRSVLIVVGDGRLVRMDIATGSLDPMEYPLGAVMPEQVIRAHLPD